jgi:hypothetical protein
MSIKTKDWYAWLNAMPPKPDDLHVIGEVLVDNPHINPILTMKEPQGINPQILMLELHLIKAFHTHDEQATKLHHVWKTARFDKIVISSKYTSVDIFFEGNKITTIDNIELVV